MSKNYACQLRPQQTRHLNALNLPQFLSRLSPKTSHTPTFKPTASARSRRRPLLLWSFDVGSCSIRGWRGLRVSKSWHSQGCFSAVNEGWGKENKGDGQCWTSTEWKSSRRRTADSHIWQHYGGSLEKQLSGLCLCSEENMYSDKLK